MEVLDFLIGVSALMDIPAYRCSTKYLFTHRKGAFHNESSTYVQFLMDRQMFSFLVDTVSYCISKTDTCNAGDCSKNNISYNLI